MLKVLIVDDEPFVREGLVELINWNELGFTVCDTAHNGKDGLDKIIKYEPEVVVIDIRMPGLSGIEVIKAANDLKLTCQFIILSGYSDFQYAKESISLGVRAYLLKPVDEDELKDVVQKVRDQFYQLSQYQQYKNKQALRNLLLGQIQGLDLTDEMHVYQIGAFIRCKDEECIIQYFKGLSKQIEMIREEQVIILLFCNMNDNLVHELANKGADYFKIQIALSDGYLKLSEVSEGYRQIKQLLERSFCFEDISILTEKKLRIEPQALLDLDQLYLGVEFNNENEKEEAIHVLEKYYQGKDYSPDRIKGDLASLTVTLLQRFRGNYPDIKFSRIETVTQKIYKQKTLQGVLRFLLIEWNQIYNQIQDRVGLKDNTIEQIKHYVSQYYDQDLNLKVVGEVFNYNSTYLGKKFKLQVGLSFPKYVDKVRIEKSKELLMEKMRVYEVSEKVGYCNIDYFYRKFKNYVGKSPKEYQKECLIKKGEET